MRGRKNPNMFALGVFGLSYQGLAGTVTPYDYEGHPFDQLFGEVGLSGTG
jgi:hypothetical protein